MSISRKQAEILKSVDVNGKKLASQLYDDKNKILLDLFDKKYISPVVDSVDGELKAVDVSLTAKGDNELSAYLDNEKNSFKNNFSYPLITNSISGVVGAVIGSFITYLLMK